MSQSLPPGPRIKSDWIFAARRIRDPLGFFTQMVRKYGDIVHLKTGEPNIFLLNDPEYIKRVLVTDARKFTKGHGLQRARILLGNGLLTSEGETHRRQRRLVQPAFHHDRIAGYASTMVDYGGRLSDNWKNGSTIDVSKEMTRLTLAIVGKTLFDTDIESEASEVGNALTTTMKLFPRYIIPYADLLQRLPLPSNRRFHSAKIYLDATIQRFIDERRATGTDKGDLLSMLLLATDEDEGGRRMTDAQARDEAMTLFIAGHETTSMALTWTWFLLSQNPNVEKRLHEEVDAVIGTRRATIADISRLKYARMVLAESMRLYPPAWVIGRRNMDEYPIGDFKIPAGSLILMSQWVMHRDQRYFSKPTVFDPERWTDDAEQTRPKFSYFPFGGGPRVCIGESFAWTEGVLLLATIAHHWRMRLVPDHAVRPYPLVTLRPRNSVKMIVEQRRS
jgi:cytochrome P450